MGCIKYNLVQISIYCDRTDAQWPFQAYLGPEILDHQPLFPFTKRSCRKICLNDISKLPTESNMKLLYQLSLFALDAKVVLVSYIRI
jgi:hypothetical protein